MTDRRILTVGHSTHPLDEFLDLLQGAGAELVVDVRRLPGSRRFPWFDQDALSLSLAEHGIRYQRIVELTGRRPIQHDVPDDVDALWHNRSFHNYADYALGQDFARGLDELVRLGGEQQVVVMCSEAVWWRCHRRIIADHLLARGIPVDHLMPEGRITAAELTPGAVVGDGTVVYPAGATSPGPDEPRPQP
ncbi:DUF488 family protein [Microbacterium sp.]|jgi:uncharacterized protein (DUF488 family)|uniref:DUF488 domain-containing protein n=1 Tax=Microbacterium sp. TaxID=51671 RepID=UPI0026068507|nr:DUF488 domain-containing protein [uncultured Microbacterium sp.]